MFWHCIFLTKNNHDRLINLVTDPEKPVRIFVEGVAQHMQFFGYTKEKGNLSKFYDGSINYLHKRIRDLLNGSGVIDNLYYSTLNTQDSIINQIRELQQSQRNFKKYKNGVGVLTAVGASVLASNLLTPIARNITANHFQKKLMKDKYKTKQIETTRPVPYRMPVSNTFSKFKI